MASVSISHVVKVFFGSESRTNSLSTIVGVNPSLSLSFIRSAASVGLSHAVPACPRVSPTGLPRNRNTLGPYNRPVTRALWCS